MLKISATNNKDYEQKLREAITSNIHNKVVLIDCYNHIHQYMFRRLELPLLFENLFVARIELAYDLLEILRNIQFNPYFKKSNTLIVTSYSHLLDDLDDKDYLEQSIKKILERLETKHNKNVVLMELKKKWDTQYRLSDLSFIQDLQNCEDLRKQSESPTGLDY